MKNLALITILLLTSPVAKANEKSLDGQIQIDLGKYKDCVSISNAEYHINPETQTGLTVSAARHRCVPMF